MGFEAYHAWFDFDDAQEAMLKQYDLLSCTELNGRSNELARRPDAYKIIAKHYNNKGWTARTCRYPALHPDFETLAVWSDVEQFGPIDALKIKQRLATMKCKLNIIKANHDASGNGFGTRTAGQSNEQHDPDLMPDLGVKIDPGLLRVAKQLLKLQVMT